MDRRHVQAPATAKTVSFALAEMWQAAQRANVPRAWVKPGIRLRLTSKASIPQMYIDRRSSAGLLRRPASWTAQLRQRWRFFKSRYPYLGTAGLIGTNVGVWGLYKISPQPQRRNSSWGAWFGEPSARPVQSRGLAGLWPDRSFWEGHFFASYYAVARQWQLETLPLCTFMHADGSHLLFNMVSLFFFGRQLEMVLGTARFLRFYLGSSILSASTQVASCAKREQYTMICGASGGVYSLLAYTTCLMPHQKVYLYMVLPVPMWLLMVGLVGADMFIMRPNTGHTGHLAGVACGIGYFALRLRPWR